jgi:hypothetical protein
MTSVNKHSPWTEKIYGIKKGQISPKIRRSSKKKKFQRLHKSSEILYFHRKNFISIGKIQLNLYKEKRPRSRFQVEEIKSHGKIR